MDCRTARHLLEFSRPQANELDDCDQEALGGHLAVCPDCDALARTEREADEHLGRAIRDVPVPQGLHERLLRRLRDEREAWYRRWLARGLRVVAAVAAVVLVAWFGLSNWRKHHLPQLDADQLASEALTRHSIRPPDRDEAEAWFRKNGFPVAAPDDELQPGDEGSHAFDYRYLFAYSLSDFPGLDKPQRVPCLLFVRTDEQGRQAQVAWVYILSGKHFNLGALPPQLQQLTGQQLHVEVWHHRPDFAYVIVYSGDRLDPLLVSKKDRSRS